MSAVLPFLFSFVIPTTSLVGVYFGGWFILLSPVVAFFIIPVLNRIAGSAQACPTESPSKASLYFSRLIPVLYIPFQFLLIYKACVLSQDGNWSVFYWILAVLNVSLTTGGVGFTMAHELAHRNEKYLRAMSGLLLSTLAYGHFMIEHVHGHHRWVATVKDPATSTKNQAVYSFFIQTVLNGFMSAIQIEKNWLARQKKSWLHNRIFITYGITVAWMLLLYTYIGSFAVLFFLLQASLSILILESINYIEHYGLTRKIMEDGKPEPVSAKHSWDSNKKFSNWILINLERHSDHHKYPTRDYIQLQPNSAAPQLPFGYAEMLLLTLIPPLWFKIMNHRLEQYERTNLQL